MIYWARKRIAAGVCLGRQPWPGEIALNGRLNATTRGATDTLGELERARDGATDARSRDLTKRRNCGTARSSFGAWA